MFITLSQVITQRPQRIQSVSCSSPSSLRIARERSCTAAPILFSSSGASVTLIAENFSGQAVKQAPHPVHFASSITAFCFFSQTMASCRQARKQRPHAEQASSSTAKVHLFDDDGLTGTAPLMLFFSLARSFFFFSPSAGGSGKYDLCVTGQTSSHKPQPVQLSTSTYRA